MPRWANRLLRFLGWTYLTYLALSLFVILPALNFAAPWAVKEFLDRELRHEILIFNPFTLTVELRDAVVLESDGHVPLSLDKAAVSLSTASLWRPGMVLDEIRVEQLMVHVLRYADGGFHFDDLLGDNSAESEASEDSGLPGVSIDALYLGARELRFTDRTRSETYSAAYSDFAVETEDLSTLPNRRGDGDLTLRGADGGEIRWQGVLAIAEGESSGRIDIQQLGLTHLWRYQSEQLAFVTDSAMIDLALNYRVSWLDELTFSVADSRFRAHELQLSPKDPESLPNTSAVVSDLLIDDIEVDSSTQSVSIGSVDLRGILLRGFTEGARASLVEMFTVQSGENNRTNEGNASSENNESSEAESEDGAADDENNWQFALASLRIDDSAAEWRSSNFAPEAMVMTPIRITAETISWPAETQSPFSVSLTVNDQTQISAEGAMHLGDGAGDVSYALETLPIPWLNPVLHRFARADVIAGLFSVNGDTSLRDFAPTVIGANVNVSRFAAQIHGAEESALGFEEFSVSGVRADLNAAQVDIEDIGLQSLRGALHILEDGSFNANSALIENPETADSETADPESADPVADGDAPDAATEGGESEVQDWGFRIAHIGVRDGQVDFSDASLPLPFQTKIGEIEADINDLDSQAEQPMVATLNGTVDGYAPVVIEARGRPLAEPREASLTLNFRGMDIATMSPYSGTYAGYTIDSGTLSVDLRYGVAGSSLDGDNRIVISQMELGEPIESEVAMQLPLKLGIALLTDASGVIDLDVPISGDVDDPQFSLGRVIGGAIANVIIKAATAPFRLLAGLVNSEEDLENIAYGAGSETLSEDGRSALASLAEALAERPKLLLRIEGSTDPSVDRRALRVAELNAQLLAAGMTVEALEARDAAYLSAIDERYAALGLPAPEDGSELTSEDKLDALLADIELPPGALQDLGIQRATAAKRELVTVGGVDAGRIAVSYDAALLTAGVKMSLDG